MDNKNILKVLYTPKRSVAMIEAQKKYQKKNPNQNRENVNKYMKQRKEIYELILSIDKNFFLRDKYDQIERLRRIN